MTTPNPKPTADVIELVKELQKRKRFCDSLNTYGSRPPCFKWQKGEGDLAEDERKVFEYNVIHSFHAVAEALLIAVDFIEKLSEDGEIKWPTDEARQVLNRIHSLHP